MRVWVHPDAWEAISDAGQGGNKRKQKKREGATWKHSLIASSLFLMYGRF
jgi:hypothetical protein